MYKAIIRLRTRLGHAALAAATLGIATAGWAAAPTAAKPAAGADENQIGAIIVTAQFRRQNLQDTPLAITAVSGAMLEARSETNIADVTNQAPSVTLKPNSASYGSSLVANIRGIGQFDFHPALEPGVGIYVDDVYYPTLTGSILDLLDLDRVEILRGPQGTLAGKNSIGGAVKLYSKKPEGSNTGYAAADLRHVQPPGSARELRLRHHRQAVRARRGRVEARGRLRRPVRLRLRASGPGYSGRARQRALPDVEARRAELPGVPRAVALCAERRVRDEHDRRLYPREARDRGLGAHLREFLGPGHQSVPDAAAV